MKRRITFSIALALSLIFLTLVSSHYETRAQRQQRFAVDTGVINLGPNQALRLTIVGPVAVVNPDHHILEFRRMTYTENNCSGSVCKQNVASVWNSGAVTLMPGEASSATFAGGTVRGIILIDSPNLQVNALIIDSATGQTMSLVQMSMQRENQ